MLNSCHIMGRLGKDPEVKQVQNGKPFANFSIACERDFKGADGKRETDWIRCVCFGATAEFVGRYLRKGRAVCVEGRLQNRKWEKDGQQREQAEIVVNNVYFANSPPQNGRENPPDSGYQGGGQNAPYQQGQSAGYGGGYGGYGGGYGGGR